VKVVVYVHSGVINCILTILFFCASMSFEESYWTTYPALPTSFILGTVDLIVPRHSVKTFAAPVTDVFCLVDAGHVFVNGGFAQHIEVFEDTLIGKV